MTGNYRIHFLPKNWTLPLIVQHSSRWIHQRFNTKFHSFLKAKNTWPRGKFNNQIVKIMNDEMSRKRRVLDKKLQRIFLAKKKMEPKPHILDQNKAKWTEFLVS